MYSQKKTLLFTCVKVLTNWGFIWQLHLEEEAVSLKKKKHSYTDKEDLIISKATLEALFTRTFPRRKDRSWLPMMCSSSVDWSFWGGGDKKWRRIRTYKGFIQLCASSSHHLWLLALFPHSYKMDCLYETRFNLLNKCQTETQSSILFGSTVCGIHASQTHKGRLISHWV